MVFLQHTKTGDTEGDPAAHRGHEGPSSTEYVVRDIPFTVRRRVKWGECDPAGVVYTVVFIEYVISAAELFYSRLLGKPAFVSNEMAGFGTPSRALELEFLRPLRPDDEFDMSVRVADVRAHTFVLHVEGRAMLGDVVFLATLTPICVSLRDWQSIEVPEPLRRSLEDYKTNCP